MMKRLQVIAGYLVAGATSAGVTCVFVLAVVLFCQVAETGSAADWIASVANLCMAVTAVCAFIVARSWLPQLTTQEGYKLAITLVNDHYIWLGIQNSVVTDVTLPLACIRHQYDQESMAVSTLTIAELVNSLEQAVRQHKVRRDTMAQIRFRLGTYGLRDAAAFAECFRTLDCAYMHATDAAASILQTLKDTQELHRKYPAKASGLACDGYVRELYLPLLREAEERFTVGSEQFQLMVGIHETIFTSYPTIGQLFVVRK